MKAIGRPLSRLAEEEGVTRQAMSAALYAPSERLELVIAEALRLTPQELFPDRFNEAGYRIPNSMGNRSTRRGGRHVRSGAAG